MLETIVAPRGSFSGFGGFWQVPGRSLTVPDDQFSTCSFIEDREFEKSIVEPTGYRYFDSLEDDAPASRREASPSERCDEHYKFNRSATAGTCSCSHAGIGRVEFCGWLRKQGSRVRSWKKRYFVLSQSSLAYFTSDDGRHRRSALRGHLVVFSVSLSTTLKYGISIKGLDGRELLVEADSEDERDVWFRNLRNAADARVASLKDELHRRRQCTSEFILQSGWMYLQKGKHSFSVWRKQYFVLTNGLISCYQDDRPQRLPIQRGIVRAVSRCASKRNGIIIHLSDGSVLRTSTRHEMERTQWIAALCKASTMP